MIDDDIRDISKMIALKIIGTSLSVADGYRSNISDHNTAVENDASEKCAVAASNTGFFILESLGYTSAQIKKFIDDAADTLKNPPPPKG